MISIEVAFFGRERHVGVRLLDRVVGLAVVDKGEPCRQCRLADFDNQGDLGCTRELDDVAVDFVDGDVDLHLRFQGTFHRRKDSFDECGQYILVFRDDVHDFFVAVPSILHLHFLCSIHWCKDAFDKRLQFTLVVIGNVNGLLVTFPDGIVDTVELDG